MDGVVVALLFVEVDGRGLEEAVTFYEGLFGWIFILYDDESEVFHIIVDNKVTHLL